MTEHLENIAKIAGAWLFSYGSQKNGYSTYIKGYVSKNGSDLEFQTPDTSDLRPSEKWRLTDNLRKTLMEYLTNNNLNNRFEFKTTHIELGVYETHVTCTQEERILFL